MTTYQDILKFWFDEIEPAKWWQKDPDFDKEIKSRFGDLHQYAINCELFSWRLTANGRLAEIIVLDQFSRNIFRDTANMFNADPLALALAQEGVERKADQELTPVQRSFMYMPFMHSESKIIHKVAVDLFTKNAEGSSLDFELQHKAIIDRFGRYPHRNQILQRASSDEELEFLRQAGSSF